MFVAEGTNIGRVKSQYTGPGCRKNLQYTAQCSALYSAVYCTEQLTVQYCSVQCNVKSRVEFPCVSGHATLGHDDTCHMSPIT